MNRINKIAIALLFTVSSFYASAQYRFADLDWGTPMDNAISTLEKKGYVVKKSLSEKIECAINSSSCVYSFSGPSVKRGSIGFRNKQLSFVGFEADDRASALNALTKKYGAPQHNSPPGIDYTIFAPPAETIGSLYWSDWRGSRLSISRDGYVSYGGEPEKGPPDSSGYKNF